MRRLSLLALFLVFIGPAVAQPQAVTAELLDGLPWRTIGPAVMSGRIVDLAVVEQDPQVFYIASATGGVWKTTNNGITVTPVFEREGTHSVGAIAVHARDTSVVWVGTGERANRQSSSWGDGVYRSTDGGQTWQHLGLDDTHHIGRIVLHPDDPDVAYVAAMGHLWGPNEARGLYRTTDGGVTWTRLLYIDDDTGVSDVAMDPSDPSTLYAAAYQRRRRPYGFHGGGPGSGLYKSTDGGATWSELTNGLPPGDTGRIGLSIYRSDPSIVYASVEQGWRYNASTRYTERRAGIYRSDDKGATWTHMSDWNPRPMYASQILVDPSDDQRVYMVNSFSYSDDGGRTFTVPRQSLHGDDRIVWVNPADSRHLIKGDDGGVGISYDRGQTWLYLTHLPVSQFYRVSVDMKHPYWVYGGLQDNGSWAGPNATTRREGILNEDWIKTGGGDGFVNLVHPDDPAALYNESQYLGLTRVDLESGQRRSLRPGDPQGRIGPRRNWDAWGPGEPPPLLGNAMEPANWDGPFLFSPHDPNTLYAGTDNLWKSTDGGATWTELADLTTGVDRRGLAIMGQVPHDSTLSLDDGIPYYPTLTAIAESPVVPGLLYVGTDDGKVQVSEDGGQTWTEVSGHLPGLPEHAWVSGIEASQVAPRRVYVALNNYRNDDFGNYVYASEDAGRTWTRIDGTLPPARVARVVKEDPRNADVLYLGTELGAFVSLDRGATWTELGAELPTMAVNDLVVHPRDNDLVLGTHSRGIWILDQLNALQELSPQVLAQAGHVFTIGPAEQIRYERERGHTGDMIFTGTNPPAGALIDYYVQASHDSASVALAIYDAAGTLVRTLEPTPTAGLHRAVWDLRHEALPALPREGEAGEAEQGRRGPAGPWVVPGRYTAQLSVGGTTYTQSFLVREDPRIDLPIDARRRWTERLHQIGALYAAAVADAAEVLPVHWKVEHLHDEGHDLDADARAAVTETHRLYAELMRRIRSLYGDVLDWPGDLTADQQSQWAYYDGLLEELAPRKERLRTDLVPRLNRDLPRNARIAVD